MGTQDDRQANIRSRWSERRPLDPALRLRLHGPIQPMDKPGLIARFFGLR